MNKKDELLDVLKSLCKGKAKAKSGKALQVILRLSRCQLHRYVNRLRREGHPIGSFSGGYYYAENAGEIYSTIKMLKRIVAALEAAIAGLEKALERFVGGEAH